MNVFGTFWRRLRALPPGWKGSLLGAAALGLLATVILLALEGASGGTPEAVAPTAQEGVSATTQATATLTLPPRPTSTPDVTTAPPGEVSRPIEGGYHLAQKIPGTALRQMLGLSMIPETSDEVVVLTQHGLVWRISISGSSPRELFGDLRSKLIAEPGLEEGLLGLAFSPNFQADGRVFLFYTAGEPRRSVLARFQVRDGTIDMASERVILEIPQPSTNHNGGQLAFGPDGYLYVAVGDGGSAGDPDGHGQNLGTLLGSIIRLDVSGDGYLVPADNPFVGAAGARPEIYAYGLRNPWRFSFDRGTGTLWAGDVGQDSWEEVDQIIRGGNYGWNVQEGFECFLAPGCDTNGLQQPRAVYGHDRGCSVTGGYVYRGPSMPELNGWYIYGDFCTGNIWAVNTADASPPVLLTATGLSISSFAELPDGEIVAVTFRDRIYRLKRLP